MGRFWGKLSILELWAGLMASSSAKRAKTREGSRLTFLPRSWWEFLDWLKEARFIMKQVTSGRCNSRAWALLNSTERYINDHFGQREFSLNAEIVEVATGEFHAGIR
jgi:hypothetical protein